MDEVSSCGQIAGDIFVLGNKVHDLRTGAIAIFANEVIDVFIFAETTDFWSQDDQFALVSDRHAGAVDRLIAQPSGMKFLGVEIADNFIRLFVE